MWMIATKQAKSKILETEIELNCVASRCDAIPWFGLSVGSQICVPDTSLFLAKLAPII